MAILDLKGRNIDLKGRLFGIKADPSTEFDPTLYGTVYRWYDASDASTIHEDGSGVERWDDKSGNGYHATQTADANRPSTGVETQNGLNVITFTGGSSDHLDTSATILTGNATEFVVWRPKELSGLYAPAGGYFTASKFGVNVRGIFNSAGNSAVHSSGSTNSHISDAGALTVNTTYIHHAVVTNNGNNICYLNGATGNTASENFNAIGTYRIGESTPIPFYRDCFICEILTYTNVLSSADRITVRDALNTKWAVY